MPPSESATPVAPRDPSLAPPEHPQLEHDDRSPGRRRATMIAALLFTIATFGVWIYAFFFYDPGLMIDELADRRFPTAAEKVCATAQREIEALPTAEETKDPVDRADVIDTANASLRRMTAALEPLVPAGQGKVTTGIHEWIDDWNTYIADRQDYADKLRTDDTVRFAESRKSNRQISLAINAFAQVNRMDSCTVPGDVG